MKPYSTTDKLLLAAGLLMGAGLGWIFLVLMFSMNPTLYTYAAGYQQA